MAQHTSPPTTNTNRHHRNISAMESNRMRKIEVQSPEDIRFLIEGFSRAVRRKIDLHLPPEAVNRDDELRKGVDSAVIEVQPNPTRSLVSAPIFQADV